MIDVEYFKPIVEQAARRIAYKMDAWSELEDIEQEMWLALIESPDLVLSPGPVISRRLGSVGARWVLAQKNLGMTAAAEERTEALSSPLDRELVEWALPQLPREYREVIRQALGPPAAPSDLNTQVNTENVSQDIENVSQDISRSDVDHSDVWSSNPILKGAFRALSQVVTVYEG